MLNSDILTESKTTFGSLILLKVLDMKHEIENESKAIGIYNSETGKKVFLINAKYLRLGASPNALILEDIFINVKGIIEMKCIKIFRGRTIIQKIIHKNFQNYQGNF